MLMAQPLWSFGDYVVQKCRAVSFESVRSVRNVELVGVLWQVN
jgi:hypothetical protein